MNDQIAYDLLITPEEAVKLCKHRTISDIYICMDIEMTHNAASCSETDQRWKHMTLLSAIWNAGRVQGIREERKRRKRITQ